MNTLFYQSILKEAKFNHGLIQFINYSLMISQNDTVSIFIAKWDKNASVERINIEEMDLKKWLNFKLKNKLFELRREK